MKRYKQLIPIFEITIGLILLLKELYQMTVLPSIQDDLYETYGLIDFSKYKENTYCLIFLWSYVLLTGLLSLLNKQTKWFANHILIFTISFGSLIAVILSIIYHSPIGFIWGLVIIGAIIIEFRFYKSTLTKDLKPTKTNNSICIIIGIIVAILFWSIELTQLNYKLMEV